ncbi:MAG: hypothetical protein WCQ57_04395, partial [Verrucomicrobiota bacterium]
MKSTPMKSTPMKLQSRPFLRFMAICAIAHAGALHMSHAQIITDFGSSGTFASNFWQRTAGTFFTQPTPYVLGQQNSTYYGNAVYDTNPGDASYTNASFTTESVSMHAAITGTLTTSPSLSLFTRVDQLTNLGFQAAILMANSTNMRMLLMYSSNITNDNWGNVLLDMEYNVYAGGSGFYRSGLNNSGGSGGTGFTLTAGTQYNFVLDQQAGNSFRLSAYDATNALMMTTGFQTNAALTGNVAASGAVGFGGIAANSAGNTDQFYNFTVAPEPSSLLLSLFAAVIILGGLTAPRRRRVGPENL